MNAHQRRAVRRVAINLMDAFAELCEVAAKEVMNKSPEDIQKIFITIAKEAREAIKIDMT